MTHQHVAVCRIEVNLRSNHFFLPRPPSPCILLTVDFSTGFTPNSLLTFVFDTATGTFGSPTTIAGAPAGIDTKVYPGGTFLYVSDFNSGSIFAYSINRSTGALTAVAGAPFSFLC